MSPGPEDVDWPCGVTRVLWEVHCICFLFLCKRFKNLPLEKQNIWKKWSELGIFIPISLLFNHEIMVKMLCLGFSFLVYVLKESAFPWGVASLGLPCLWYCVMVWFSTCAYTWCISTWCANWRYFFVSPKRGWWLSWCHEWGDPILQNLKRDGGGGRHHKYWVRGKRQMVLV